MVYSLAYTNKSPKDGLLDHLVPGRTYVALKYLYLALPPPPDRSNCLALDRAKYQSGHLATLAANGVINYILICINIDNATHQILLQFMGNHTLFPKTA